MNKSKGFTIIELIVVIAIIAVLAAIVLVNVTSYINKGKDAAIKGNLSTLLTNSAAYFDTNSNLTNFKTDTVTGCNGPINAAITGAGGTLVCYTNGTNFAACSVEKVNSSQYFCVDSSGVKKEGGTTCSTPVCP